MNGIRLTKAGLLRTNPAGLRIRCPKGRGGSNPLTSTSVMCRRIVAGCVGAS